ncbi:Nucleic-acid-binding protein from transposon X-element [Eumeta japonica]|uniref:Nucleic-acid-binding protein from transposon X-element n=1 Tax=Eumeta variegata TaxID=151549 RepID=A0A4C1TDH9_EUMVA|nr:Nucleic-acid-binding protein from transposon X-element [Eumeta japonica]
MENQRLKDFLTERGHFDLLREFEVYCASPASPDAQDIVFDPDMVVEYIQSKKPNKRPVAVCPSENSTSDSDPGWSDVSDHSDFTTDRCRKASRIKPEALCLTQATDGSTYFRVTSTSKKPKKVINAKATIPAKSTQSIHNAPESWRISSQSTAASQGAVDTGKFKAAAPAAAQNNNISDEADVTTPPRSAPRGPKPPPVFVQNKDRWTELRKRCVDKNIQISQARNSVQGLKLQKKTVADFRNLQNLLVLQKFALHTYSLKEERKIRVALRGVPREIPFEEVKEDLSQNLPVQSVRRIQNRFRESLDLVLVSGTAEANAKATKATFFKIRSVCSLSGVKAKQPRKRALPGQCHNYQSYGHSSRHCFNPARCVKCLGNHGTAQCTRNKDTDEPPPAEKAAPRRAPARAFSSTLSYARAAAGPRNVPPAAKHNQTSADDLSHLMSIISIIDTNELAILAKKFCTAANPTEKLICLIEHALPVETACLVIVLKTPLASTRPLPDPRVRTITGVQIDTSQPKARGAGCSTHNTTVRAVKGRKETAEQSKTSRGERAPHLI